LIILGKLIDIAMRDGLNSLSSVSFSHTDVQKYQQQALKKALEDAQRKSLVVEKTMGLKGMKVLNIHEGLSRYNPIHERDRYMKALSSTTAENSTRVIQGQLSAQAGATVEYSFISARR